MLRYALAALSGVLYFLGFAGFDLWPLAFVALVPVLWALDPRVELGRWQLIGLGLTFGFATNVGGYYWLVEMLENFSGFSYALCVLFAAVLWAYQGVALLLFVWLYRRGRQAGFGSLLAACAAMCFAEFSFPLLFEHYFGASLHNVPLTLQVADLGGPLLVTGLLTLANAGIYTLIRSWREGRIAWREPAIAAGAWVLTLGYGAYRMHATDSLAASAPSIQVGLVQTNMGLFQKREDPEEGLRRHIQQSVELTKQHQLDLLVWPESAFGWYIPQGVRNVREVVLGNVIDVPTLFGGLARREVSGEKRPFNTAFLADGKGMLTGSYDKIYLLAFGEYIPLGELFPFLYEWSPNSSHFAQGTHLDPLLLGQYRLSTLICYEDILPAFVRGMVKQANPHLFINISNDAWFGDTHEPWQHLALAKLRTVEHHRALVRSTNSGVSAVVDPAGRVITHSKVFTRENLTARVPMLTGSYPYQTLGDFPGYLSVLVLAYAFYRARKPASTAGKRA